MGYSIEYVYKLIDKYSDQLKHMADNADKFAEKSHKATEKASGGFRLFGIAVGSILTAETIEKVGEKVFQFGEECLKTAEKAQVSMTLLKNTIKNMAATGGPTFDELEKKAQLLSKNSIFSGEQILRGSTQALLMFHHVQGPVFNQVQKAAIDVTAAFDGINASSEDLKGRATMIGRALENPIGGMMRLRQIGVIFSEQQKHLIKNLMAQGNLEAAQQVVLQQIYSNPKIKGAAEALAMSSEGMKRRISNSMEEMKIKIGTALMPLEDTLLNLGLKIMPILSNSIEKLMPVIQAIMKVFEDLSPTIELFVNSISDILNGVMPIISRVLAIVPVLMRAIAPIFTVIVGAIKQIFDALEPLISALMDLIPTIVDAISPLIEVIGPLIQSLLPIITPIIKIVSVLFQSVFVPLLKLYLGFESILWRLYAVIIKIATTIINAITSMGRTMMDKFSWIKDGLHAFEQLINSILNGIANNPIVKGLANFLKVNMDVTGIKEIAGKASENTKGNAPAIVPEAKNNEVNVNTKSQISVFTEKNMMVLPYKKEGTNLGWQGAQ